MKYISKTTVVYYLFGIIGLIGILKISVWPELVSQSDNQLIKELLDFEWRRFLTLFFLLYVVFWMIFSLIFKTIHVLNRRSNNPIYKRALFNSLKYSFALSITIALLFTANEAQFSTFTSFISFLALFSFVLPKSDAEKSSLINWIYNSFKF